MAAFVFVSGYFYKETHEEHVGTYIARKFRRLIVPLILINFVYGLGLTLAEALSGADITFGVELSLESIFILPFTNGHQFGFTLAMWFIPPLFATEVINIFLRKLIPWGKHTVVRELLFFVVYLGFGVGAMIVGGADGIEPSFTLFVCRTALFMSFFAFGRLYKALLEKHDNLNSVAYFAIVFVVQLLCYYFGDRDLGCTPVWCEFPYGVVLSYLPTITGLAFLLRVCRILGPVIGRHKAVLAIADNTYSIMAHHIFAFFLLTGIVGFMTSLDGQSGFSAGLYLSDIWYRYFDYEYFKSVYLVVGICVPLLIHWGWKHVYDWVTARITKKWPARKKFALSAKTIK